GPQRRSERQNLPGDLLPDLPGVVPVLDLEVRLEEIDQGQVRGGLAVRDRAASEDEPAVGLMGVHELVEEARLADPGFAHYSNDLAMPPLGPFQCPAERCQLGVAAHEPREPPGDGCLEARPCGAAPVSS